MKRFIVTLVSGCAIYISSILMYPYVLAYVNDVDYVAGTNLLRSIPKRWMVVIDKELAYLDDFDSFGIKVSRISEKGNSDKLSLEIDSGHSYTFTSNSELNKYVMISWKDPWFSEAKNVTFNVCVITEQGGCDTTPISLNNEATTYGIFDYKDGMLLGRSLLTSEESGEINGTVFLLDKNSGELSVISAGGHRTSDSIPAPGKFWKDGLIYEKGTDVFFRSKSGHEEVIAAISPRIQMEYYSNNDSLIWLPRMWSQESKKDPPVYWYRGKGEVFEFYGTCPDFVTDGIIFVRRGQGIYHLRENSETELIHNASYAWCASYFKGKLYWSEKRVNYAYPLHFLLYSFGFSNRLPEYYQSYIFSKKWVEVK